MLGIRAKTTPRLPCARPPLGLSRLRALTGEPRVLLVLFAIKVSVVTVAYILLMYVQDSAVTAGSVVPLCILILMERMQAHSVVEEIESMSAMGNKTLVPLSVQEVTSCDIKQKWPCDHPSECKNVDDGCDGGIHCTTLRCG